MVLLILRDAISRFTYVQNPYLEHLKYHTNKLSLHEYVCVRVWVGVYVFVCEMKMPKTNFNTVNTKTHQKSAHLRDPHLQLCHTSHLNGSNVKPICNSDTIFVFNRNERAVFVVFYVNFSRDRDSS